MGKVITVANQKGGTGKTSCAVHLLHWCSQKASTLLIDADSQESSTRWLQGDDNVIISDVNQVKNTFESLGKLKWESFVINRLRLLNLPEAILEAIRQGEIEYTKGIIIARVKDEEFRDELLKEAITDNLSLNEIKDKIAQNKGQKNNPDYSELPTEDLVKDIRQTYQKLSRSKKVWSNQKNRKKIETLLKQLKSLIDE